MSTDPEPSVQEAVDALRGGGVIVYPTETVYGLGADALSPPALRRLIDLKGRSDGKPFLVLVRSRDRVFDVAGEVSAAAERLMAAFWPGPLTLVLPAREELPAELIAGTGTIGVRVSSHPVARSIVETLDRPITSTSANPSGEAPAETVERARTYFADAVDVYVDGGPSTETSASTLVDCTKRSPSILRAGPIAEGEIARVVRG